MSHEKELDDLLCGKYPKIFAERYASPMQTCMNRGFECADGWFDLIDMLCERLQFETDHNKAPQVVAVQVKEKFGELRFYTRNANERQRGMIDMAQAFSSRICDQCGNRGKTMVDGWLFMTRCAAHTPESAITADEFIAKRGDAR